MVLMMTSPPDGAGVCGDRSGVPDHCGGVHAGCGGHEGDEL